MKRGRDRTDDLFAGAFVVFAVIWLSVVSVLLWGAITLVQWLVTK